MAADTLTDPERAFLAAVKDDASVFRVFQKHDIGYGWAIERGFVTKVGATGSLDFRLTPLGRTALDSSNGK